MSEPHSSPPTPPPRPAALSRPGPVLKKAGASRRIVGGVSLSVPEPAAAPKPAAPVVPEVAPRVVATEEPDYHAIFRSEAEELLGGIDGALLEWPSPEALGRITRGFHTLCGSARTLGMERIGVLASGLENKARALQDGAEAPSESHRLELRQGCAGLAHELGWDWVPRSPGAAATATDAVLARMVEELEAWAASEPTAAGRFRDALDEFRRCGEPEVPAGLNRSFGQLSEFLDGWGTVPPPAPMQAVLRRCLADAREYLQTPTASRAPWRRRWGLYFNSLRVALAVENNPSAGPAAQALDPEMVQAFMEEARALFESIEQAVLRWERGEGVPECRAELRRHFHTLKGAANSVGLSRLGTAYHELEERMERAEASPAPPSDLLAFNDRVRAYLAALQENPAAAWEGAGDPPVASDPPVDPDLLEAFLEEARQLLEPIETALMAWERGEDASARQAELRRHFHTLKGAANSIGLKALGADFHTLEERMQQAVDEAERARWIPLVLACMDDTRTYLAALASDPASSWAGGWEARFSGSPADKATAAGAPAPAEKAVVRVEADRVRQLLDQSGEMVADLSRAESYFQDLGAVRRRMEYLREQMVRESEDVRSGHPAEAATLVAWEKECAALSAELSRLQRTHGTTQGAVLRRGRQLQKDLAGLNMGPVSNLFRRLQRVFRDALQEEAKQAALQTEGGQTRLDRTVLDRLYGPLLHVVRNAVAHGIEKPEVRGKSGKPVSGTVRLAAIPFSDHVRIEVSDDGAGIDGAAVRRRAIQRGLLAADAPELSDDEIIRLLFTPGFSTKETVSSVAGRGVGLDVVKEEIEGMNGSVSVRFTAGQGAVWTIRVPLNLSASEALLVRAGELRAALPLAYVVRCHRLRESDFESRGGRLVLASNGLPYFALHEVLGSSAGEDPTHGIEVDAGSMRAVLGVHAILTRREVVSLDPGPLLRRMPVLSGVAPDSDGSLLPVLQIPQMLRRLGGAEHLPVAGSETRPLRILLVDDSSSVRLAHRVLLEKIGWSVDVAVDGVEALGKIRADGGYDLILSDLEMPGLDGRGLLKALRSEEATRKLPLIMVTSRRETAMIEALLAEGADACLAKPLDVYQLVSTVSRLETPAASP